MNEWQPFWNTLKEKITSFSRNYLSEKKVDTELLSRFWPSSNLEKKDLSKSSNLSPVAKFESEPSVPLAKPKVSKPRVRSKNVDEDISITIKAEPVKLRPYAKNLQAVAEKIRSRRKKLTMTPLNNVSIVSEQPEANVKTKRIVEAILFAARRPMTAKQVQQVFPELEQPELSEILSAIDSIIEDYRFRPIELKAVASGYRFQVRQELSRWVSRLFEEKPPKYSRALLETLAIIAYKQPVTRGEIEDIRGVSVSSSIIQTLLEREWVKVVAYKEVPGRPGLYGTTKQFLDYFNIASINELPTLQEIQHLEWPIDKMQQPTQVTSEKQETN